MAETKSGSVKLQWHGEEYGNSGATYIAPVTNKPKLYSTVSWSVTRSSQQSSTVTVSVSGNIWRLFAPNVKEDTLTGNYGTVNPDWTAYYGYHINVYVNIGGQEKLLASKDASPSTWTSDITGTTHSYDITWDSNDTIPVTFRVDAGCHIAKENWCSAGNFSKVVAYAEVPTYNPYTEPSIYAVTSYTKIVRGGANSTVNYEIQCGAGGSIHWVRKELYKDGTSWQYGKYANVESSISGNCVYTDYALQPNDNMWANGSYSTTITLPNENHKKYKLAIRFSDCHHQWISGDDKNIYTYTPPTEPNVKLNVDGTKYATIDNVTTISPQDSASVSFTIGSRGWNDDNIEKSFTTEFKCNSYTKNDYAVANDGNNVVTANKVVALTSGSLNDMLTKAERSKARVSTTVSVKNLNPSANWSASGSVTFNVQYQPRLAPVEEGVKYGGVSYKGATVLITKVPKVTVSWSYEINKGAAGVVNGYKYTVYADSSKKTVMKTDKVSGTSVDINTSEMNLGTMNYIVITPYYTKPDGTGDMDGAQSVGFNLVKPLNKLYKPVIEYPQKDYTLDDTSTTAYWHNKNFRVCFVSSQDPDLSKIISTQGVTAETYEYNNIQVDINGTIYSYSDHSAMFSRAKTGHLHHFVINPSLISGFGDASYYNIKIRFQKKYFANTSSEDSWSDWSDTLKITMHTLPTQTFTAGQEIKATHLDNIKKHIIHAYNAYSSTDVTYSDTPVGNSIAYGTFKTYYDYIQAIKKTVNEYGAFTRNAVKFDTANATETIDEFKEEFITASNDVKYADDSTGSNYFKLLEESLKNLK